MMSFFHHFFAFFYRGTKIQISDVVMVLEKCDIDRDGSISIGEIVKIVTRLRK